MAAQSLNGGALRNRRSDQIDFPGELGSICEAAALGAKRPVRSVSAQTEPTTCSRWPRAARCRILQLLCEGLSIRAIEHTTGTSPESWQSTSSCQTPESARHATTFALRPYPNRRGLPVRRGTRPGGVRPDRSKLGRRARGNRQMRALIALAGLAATMGVTTGVHAKIEMRWAALGSLARLRSDRLEIRGSSASEH